MILTGLMTRSQTFNDKIALQDEETMLSYTDLYDLVVEKAGALLSIPYITTEVSSDSDVTNSKSVRENANAPIAVIIDRNVESIAAFLSVAITGNFYAPIDVSQPPQRMQLIIDSLAPEIIINASGKVLPDLAITDSTIIDFDELAINNHDRADLCERLRKIERSIIDTDPLYAMYTSGSTGVPKGALISRRAIYDLVAQFNKEFDFREDDVFGNQAPFDFDVSVKDIYNALYIGATIVIIPRVHFSFPVKLIDFLNDHKITVGIWSVSVLRIVENLRGLKNGAPLYMRQIMFSGEVMSNKTLNYWRSHLTNTTFVNLYGPTEITCNCTFYIVDQPYEDDESLPIGIPFENTRIIILDEQNRLITDPNKQGEICVVGSSLALGYYNNSEMTDSAFVQNPLQTKYEETIYRTGDLGHYNDHGLLMFDSRKDHQIKHMGHRIELGEIEKNANALSSIEVAVCIYDAAAERIVMFYQSDIEQKRNIYLNLMSALPKYMIPNKMIHYQNLPLNKNGKIDRVLLEKSYHAD